ncbi:MAG: peptidoglycan DD-metalloendopeptidase family protein [Candidatus Promineifilaceae bacterium]|nr:peptidoglycan DD-metalloendopeptidase family protein [Candidatus Promineifilaceae bacterium]
MNEDPNLLQRYGGHIVLLIVALLLVLGSRTAAVADLLESAAAEPAAADTSAFSAFQAAAPAAKNAASQEAAAEGAGASTGADEGLLYDISEVPVRSDASLAPAPIPITYRGSEPDHDFITYTVESGDTAIAIAKMFGIKEETILGGNSFLSTNAGQLWAGTEIVILPVDGVLHDVVAGDSLEGIAEEYDIPIEDIVAYEPNQLEFPYRLYPGTQILVPGAVREAFYWDPPNYASSGSSSPEAMQGIFVAVPGTGTFIWPSGGRRITQQPWYGHMALDIGLVTGSPIYASDTGTVTYSTWSPYCYGNLIVINHGNGFESFYAHLSGFNVRPGQTVYQGNLIGWSGNTGCSSGPHLHFEVRYGKARQNPYNYLP